MTIKTIKLTDLSPVDFVAQGFEGTFSPEDFESAEAVDLVITYGVRRMVQDFVNSLAKAKRDADEDVTEAWVTEQVEKRVAAIKAGTVSVRGAALDPHTQLRVDTLRAAASAKKGNAWLTDMPEAVAEALGADRVSSADVAEALVEASEEFLDRLDRETRTRAKQLAKRADLAAKRAAVMAELAGIDAEVE